MYNVLQCIICDFNSTHKYILQALTSYYHDVCIYIGYCLVPIIMRLRSTCDIPIESIDCIDVSKD